MQLLIEVSERPYALKREGRGDARDWLADIKAGKWPERARRTYLALAGGAIITEQKVLPVRALASRQAKILRRMVEESERTVPPIELALERTWDAARRVGR